MWGFLSLFYIAWKSKDEKERRALQRELDKAMIEKRFHSDTPADYEYDLWEARIKKYCDKYPTHLPHARGELALLNSHRIHNSPLGRDIGKFAFYKNIEISDEELEEFRKIRLDWENEVHPALREMK